MTTRTRWPQAIPRQQVNPKRRFQQPSTGIITFAELAAPGRAGTTVDKFWKMKLNGSKSK